MRIPIETQKSPQYLHTALRAKAPKKLGQEYRVNIIITEGVFGWKEQ